MVVTFIDYRWRIRKQRVKVVFDLSKIIIVLRQEKSKRDGTKSTWDQYHACVHILESVS